MGFSLYESIPIAGSMVVLQNLCTIPNSSWPFHSSKYVLVFYRGELSVGSTRPSGEVPLKDALEDLRSPCRSQVSAVLQKLQSQVDSLVFKFNKFDLLLCDSLVIFSGDTNIFSPFDQRSYCELFKSVELKSNPIESFVLISVYKLKTWCM